MNKIVLMFVLLSPAAFAEDSYRIEAYKKMNPVTALKIAATAYAINKAKNIAIEQAKEAAERKVMQRKLEADRRKVKLRDFKRGIGIVFRHKGKVVGKAVELLK